MKMADRLKESLGVTEGEIQSCREKLTSKQWCQADVVEALEESLVGNNSDAPCSLTEAVRARHSKGCPEGGMGKPNPVLLYLVRGPQPAWTKRPCWEGRPGHSAMKPRLRRLEAWREEPLPTLKWTCRMCEAEFPNVETLDKHIDLLHGQYRFYSTWLAGAYSQCPYVPSPTEKRGCVEHFAAVQQRATSVAEDEPFVQLPDQASRLKLFWSFLYEQFSNGAAAGATFDTNIVEAKKWASFGKEDPEGPEIYKPVYQEKHEGRSFEACVFCARLHWSEHLAHLYLVGQECTMQNPAEVAALLSMDWYSQEWPMIPKAELEASAIDFPYQSEDGQWTTKKVLMHKRRVKEEHLNGTAAVLVCEDCHEAFWKKRPKLSKWSLSNYNWLGRHLPIFRDTTLGHQLLLALGRVVSTKVYLSSKGVDVVTRQHSQVWRKKFLQQGMSGTAIVYGNGSADDAMASFPPGDDVLQDSFVAVFTGPEAEVILSPAEQEEQARAALRREVELHVCKKTYEDQAEMLMRTNYVYNRHKGGYMPNLAAKLPETPSLPACFEACAKFIPLDSSEVDVTKATGLGIATTAAQQELESAEKDEEE